MAAELAAAKATAEREARRAAGAEAAKARMAALQSASMAGVVETTWAPEPLAGPAAPGDDEHGAAYALAAARAAERAAGAGPPPARDLRTTDFLRMTAAAEPRAAPSVCPRPSSSSISLIVDSHVHLIRPG